MNYDEAISYIHSLLRFGIKPGMQRIRALLERLGNPQNALEFIHVAGTNGKGTVCAELSEILCSAGFKAGLFISPYVVDFRERIQISSAMISKAELAKTVGRIKPEADELTAVGLQPTEFEFITAAAMLYFKEQGCDIVVLETGLGGLLDSTNIIDTPLVSVITSVCFDHMDILGGTLSEIAYQKCGIIKPSGYTVSYPIQSEEAFSVIKKTAAQKNNKLICADASKLEIISENINGSDIIHGGSKLHIPLLGRHQIYNTLTALSTVEALREQGIAIPDAAVKEGIAKAFLPARLEVISKNPLLILDGGHNKQGAMALSQTIERCVGKKTAAVIGMMDDKDCEGAVSLIAPQCEKIILTRPDNPRSANPERLFSQAKKYCESCIIEKDPQKAVETLFKISEGLPMIICGSLYLAGEIRERALSFFHQESVCRLY